MMNLIARSRVQPEPALAPAESELLAMDGNSAFFASKTMA